jgi:alpha-tubulin suppressor-like RCC1 family protein
LLPPRPLAIAAGRYHTLLLRQGEAGGGHGASVWEEGGAARVYACGRNVCGQLGLPLATAATATPTVVSQLETLLKPRLWLGPGLRGAGGSREGEGRMGGEEASGVVKGDSVCAVACGAMHSVALTRHGRVISWGSNGFGQLGVGVVGAEGGSEGSSAISSYPPAFVEIDARREPMDEVVGVGCGSDHTVLLSASG